MTNTCVELKETEKERTAGNSETLACYNLPVACCLLIRYLKPKLLNNLLIALLLHKEFSAEVSIFGL
jgi:hypothetical protein